MTLTQITEKGIKDGEIINADINAGAAIAGSKINPNFGSQQVACGSVDSNGGIIGASLQLDSSTVNYLYYTDSLALTKSGHGAELTIDSSGQVGIGTTSPDNTLHLLYSDGQTYNTNIRNAGLQIENNNGTDNTYAQLHLRAGNSDVYFRAIREGSNLTSLAFLTDNGGSTSDAGEAMRIDSSGRVGIGTATSIHALEVQNNSDHDNIIVARGADSSTEYAGMGVNGGNAVFTGGGVGSTSAGMVFRTAASGTEAERMRITSDGKIGIGTTSPAELLHLQSTAGNTKLRLTQSGSSTDQINGAIHFGNSTDGQLCEIRGYTSGATNSGYLQFRTTSGGNDVTAMTINTTGNVGIGTNSPVYPLHVKGAITDSAPNDSGVLMGLSTSNYAQIQLNGTAGAFIDFSTANVDKKGRIIYHHSDNALQFWTNNGEQMRILSSGDVIIGSTINPGVDENLYFEDGGTIRRRYGTNNGIGIHLTNGSFMPTTKDGTYANGSGDVGNSTYRWGTVYAATGSINTSDKTVKNTIATSDLGLDFISKLKPVSYKFNNGTSGRTHYGLISQDVEEVLTDIGKTALGFAGFCKDKNYTISLDENGHDKKTETEGYNYSLRYEEFIGPIVKALQELSAKVTALEAK